MKVYVVNVNNCMAYSDYYEGNQHVFSSLKKAAECMKARGFDLETRRRVIPWDGVEDWRESGMYDEEEFRIEEWEVE